MKVGHAVAGAQHVVTSERREKYHCDGKPVRLPFVSSTYDDNWSIAEYALPRVEHFHKGLLYVDALCRQTNQPRLLPLRLNRLAKSDNLG
jgi:hypothetical protein